MCKLQIETKTKRKWRYKIGGNKAMQKGIRKLVRQKRIRESSLNWSIYQVDPKHKWPSKYKKKKKKKHSPEKCSLTAKLHFQMNPKWSTQWGKGNYNDGWVRFIILKKGKRFWFWGVCNRVNKLYQVPLHLFTARLECFIFQKYVNEHIISFTCSKSYWLHCFNQELPRKKIESWIEHLC